MLGVPAVVSKYVREAALESGCFVLATLLCLWRLTLWFEEVARLPNPPESWNFWGLDFVSSSLPWSVLLGAYALATLFAWIPGMLGKLAQLWIFSLIGREYWRWAVVLLEFWRGRVPGKLWFTVRPTLLDLGALALFAWILGRQVAAAASWFLKRARSSHRQEIAEHADATSSKNHGDA